MTRWDGSLVGTNQDSLFDSSAVGTARAQTRWFKMKAIGGGLVLISAGVAVPVYNLIYPTATPPVPRPDYDVILGLFGVTLAAFGVYFLLWGLGARHFRIYEDHLFLPQRTAPDVLRGRNREVPFSEIHSLHVNPPTVPFVTLVFKDGTSEIIWKSWLGSDEHALDLLKERISTVYPERPASEVIRELKLRG